MDKQHIHFGRWLASQIEQRLWTRAQFAAEAGVSCITVQRWIRKDNLPNGRALVRIAKSLHTQREVIEQSLAKTESSFTASGSEL